MARPLLKSRVNTVIITGIIHKASEDPAPKYYNLIVTSDGCQSVSSEIHGGSYSGTGDLLASVVCADMVRGNSAYCGVARAVRFLEAALAETASEDVPRNDGINFEPFLSMLLE